MSGRAELVERDDERQALGRAVAAGLTGAGSLIVVDGPPGIGKSALLGELASLGTDAGMRVLMARAGEFERDFAYGTVRMLLEREVAGLDPDARAAVGAGPAAYALRLLADLGGTVIGLQAALHGIYWLVANLAASRPIALVVDDAHWCDEESLLALSYVARRRDGLRLVLAVARRPEAGGPTLAELAADPFRVGLRPRPLSAGGVRACLADALGRPVDAELAGRAHAATGGNPLLVTEIGREIARAGATGVEDALAADSLGPLFRERIRRLGADSALAAGALAVLGDDADPGMLAEVTGMPEAVLERALARLRVEGVLDAGLAFAHPLARAAARRNTGTAERRRVAVAACRLLRARGAPPERATALVAALVPAGDPEIVELLRSAAAAALARGAPLAAVAGLERALAEPPAAPDRAVVLLELGIAARRAELTSAVGHLYGAFAAADDPGVGARAALELGRALGAAGRRGEAAGVLGQALPGAPPGLDQALRGALASLAAEDGADPGGLDPDGIDEAAPGAAALLAAAAYARAREGHDRAGALALAHRAARRAVDEGDMDAGLRAVRVMIAGGDGGALGAANQLAAAAARLAASDARAAAHVARGEALMAAGMPRDAEGDLLDAVAVAASAGLGDLEHHATTALVEAMVVRAETAAARAALEAAPDRGPSGDADLLRRLARARLAHAERDPAGALRDALSCAEQHTAAPLLSPAVVPWRGVAAQAALALGDPEQARRLAAEEVALAEAWGAPGPRARALLAVALADGSAAAFDAALAAAQAAGPLERARALLARGSALRRAGERSDGRVDLAEAYTIAGALGAEAIAMAAAVELEASGQPRRADGSDPVATLTASERRVAVLAADGASNREIAQSLFVTAKTVETHLSHTFRKLGISRRAQLAELLAERPAGIPVYA